MKLVMDLVVNHTSDEHPWFVESRSSQDNPKRDWYWWRPPRDGHATPGEPGAEPTNWESFFSGSGLGARRGARGEYYLHLFSRKQPDLNWENPEVRAGGLRDDALVARPRRRRLPDGRHQPDLQGPGAARRPRPDRRHVSATASPHLHQRPADPRVPAGDAPRGLRRPAGAAAHRRRDARRAPSSEAATVHRPGPRARSTWSSSSSTSASTTASDKWDRRPLRPARRSRRRLGRWQAALADVGWNSLYWNNHDQPRAVSRFGDDGRVPRRARPRCWPRCCTCTAGTPYVYQGEELGMTNVPLRRASTTSATSSRSTTTATAVERRAATPEDVLAALRAKEPRQRAHPDAVGRLRRTPASPPGTPWLAGQPEPRRDQRRRRSAPTRTRCSTTTGG